MKEQISIFYNELISLLTYKAFFKIDNLHTYPISVVRESQLIKFLNLCKEMNFDYSINEIENGLFINDYRIYDIKMIQEIIPTFKLNERLLLDIEATSDQYRFLFIELLEFRISLELAKPSVRDDVKDFSRIKPILVEYVNLNTSLINKMDKILIHFFERSIINKK
jgi:hypothetical protein